MKAYNYNDLYGTHCPYSNIDNHVTSVIPKNIVHLTICAQKLTTIISYIMYTVIYDYCISYASLTSKEISLSFNLVFAIDWIF